jgi:hypothetical protein
VLSESGLDSVRDVPSWVEKKLTRENSGTPSENAN